MVRAFVAWDVAKPGQLRRLDGRRRSRPKQGRVTDMAVYLAVACLADEARLGGLDRPADTPRAKRRRLGVHPL